MSGALFLQAVPGNYLELFRPCLLTAPMDATERPGALDAPGTTIAVGLCVQLDPENLP